MKINFKHINILQFTFIAIIFNLLVSINFFIKNQFFMGNSTNLTLFFAVIPFFAIILVPTLCYKQSISVYDDFLPLSTTKKIIQNFFTNLLKFTILILFLIPNCLVVNFFGNIDFGKVFTSLFCLIFYGASLISLCIFINQIIKNKITAFIVSALSIGLFSVIHMVGLYVQLPKTISAILNNLSFAWHFDQASKGIFNTKDIFWLAGFSILFILLTIFVTEKQKGKKLSKNKLITTIFSLIVTVLFMLNSTRYNFRIDFSKNKTFSLSSYSKEFLENISFPVNISYYCSNSLSALYPQITEISDYLSMYSNQNKNINYIKKDPDSNENAKKTLDTYGIFSQQMKTQKNNTTQYIDVYSAIIIEYNGNTQVIPFIMSASTLEFDLISKIKTLITNKQRIVNIIVGNGMSLSSDYDFLVPWLNNQGFVCNEIHVENPNFANELKNTTGPLFVIGDSQIKIAQTIEIENYILTKNQNALFTVSPYSSNIEGDWNITQNQNTNIVEMIENWGVVFTENIVADISSAQITMYSQQSEDNQFSNGNTQTQVLNYPLWVSLLPQENATLGATIFWPVELSILAENAKPFFVSSPMGYTYQTDRNSPHKLIESNPFVLQTYDIKSKEKSTKTIGAQIKGKISGLFNNFEAENANIIVIPDQYFVNSLMNGYIGGEYGDYRNYELTTNILYNLNNESELSQIKSKLQVDESLFKISTTEEFLHYLKISNLILFVIMPCSILILGIVLWILKKKKLTSFLLQLQ